MKTVESTSLLYDAIIDCASGRFRAVGYKKTTVEEIATDLRISKKTLYSVFSSKEAILRETTWRDVTRSVKTTADAISDAHTPDAMLIACVRSIFEDRIRKGRNGLYWWLFSEDEALQKSATEALGRVFADLYEEGRQARVFKPLDPVFAVECIQHIIQAALNSFARSASPASMFNDAILAVADAVAYRDRMRIDTFG